MLEFMRYLFIFLSLLTSLLAQSQSTLKNGVDILYLHDQDYVMVIDSNDEYTVDSKELPWKAVKGIHFVDHKHAPHALFKFKVNNQSEVDRQLLMHADLHWEHVVLYQDGIKVGQSGKTMNRSDKTIDDNFQIIPISLKKGQESVLLFDVRSEINYGTRISLISMHHFLVEELSSRKSLVFFYGILAVLFVFNLIWFLITKERLRLAYCFYVFAMAFYSGKADNYMVYSLFPEHASILYYEYFINKLVFALGIGTYVWAYLAKDKQDMKQAEGVKYITLIYVIQYLIELAITGTNYYYHSLILLVWGYVIIICLSSRLRKKEYLLIIALFFVALGVSTSMMQALNWRSFTTQFTIYAIDYSFIVDALFFAIITAKKVRDASKNTIVLQDELIIQMKENEILQSKVNKELEEKVQERTFDIESKNNELGALNKKLKDQADQIMKMNEQLDLRNYKLKKENKEIRVNSLVGVPLSLEEVKNIYPDQLSCLRFLQGLKWKDGFRCRKCVSESFQELDQMKGKRCSKCGATEAITSDTLFERLRIPLDKAFYIAYLVFHQRDRIKVADLANELDVNTKTCYNFVNKCNERERHSWDVFVYPKSV